MEGVRVREAGCGLSVSRAPVTDSVRVCSARGEVQCSGPCYKVDNDGNMANMASHDR